MIHPFPRLPSLATIHAGMSPANVPGNTRNEINARRNSTATELELAPEEAGEPEISQLPTKPRAGVDFERAAARRGDELFKREDKANCARCHHESIWTEPGWNAHKPADLRIDSFQADRSPDRSYKTMNLAALFVRERGLFMKPENKGRFYHDVRFQTLLDVVQSYKTRFGLNLTDEEMRDVVEYLKSL